MIINIARKILPKKVRMLLGVGLNKLCQRFPLISILFVYLLYGILMRPYRDKFLISHRDIKLLLPRRDWSVFLEIFVHQVYERFFSVSQGDVVIDIGAHVGLFTIKAAKTVRESGLVVAIEPEPRNIGLLRHNIASNGIDNVKVVEKAVFSHKAKAKLYLSTIPRSHSLLRSLTLAPGSYIEVEADSLDHIVSELKLKQVNFIKIDTEGSELEILKGGEKTLEYPDVKLSIAAYHTLADGIPEFPQIISLLSQRGFEIYTYQNQYIYAVRSPGNSSYLL